MWWVHLPLLGMGTMSDSSRFAGLLLAQDTVVCCVHIWCMLSSCAVTTAERKWQHQCVAILGANANGHLSLEK